MMNDDLFGEPLTHPVERVPGQRKPTPLKGYAAEPGTGPPGETCGSCRHHRVIRYSKSYHKCEEFKNQGGKWTGGPGTDIRVRSPACRFWEAGEAQQVFGSK